MSDAAKDHPEHTSGTNETSGSSLDSSLISDLQDKSSEGKLKRQLDSHSRDEHRRFDRSDNQSSPDSEDDSSFESSLGGVSSTEDSSSCKDSVCQDKGCKGGKNRRRYADLSSPQRSNDHSPNHSTNGSEFQLEHSGEPESQFEHLSSGRSSDRPENNNAVIASHGVKVKHCNETAVVGVRKAGRKPQVFEGFDQSVITRNLYALNSLHVGSIPNKSSCAAFSVSGDAVIEGNISASHIKASSIYVAGVDGTTVTQVIRPCDNVDIIYVNPVAGPIQIQLGATGDFLFQPNRQIQIKDVTPEFASAASYNVFISVPLATIGTTGHAHPYTQIEYFATQDLGTYVRAANDGVYSLNTSGGAVSFRYASFACPLGSSAPAPTWTLQNQFIGNARLVSATGFTFAPSVELARSRLLHR